MTKDAMLGQKLDDYTLVERVGAGATGVVYRADGPDGPVAVKVLNEALGHISALRRRFQREARALTKLEHPNIVHIEHFGVVDNHVYIAMELLDGTTLEDQLQVAPASPELAVHVGRHVLAALAFAHDLQIVHRDLKPANIFLVDEGAELPTVKILDFGLAKFLSVEELSHDGTLTRRGRVVGTPAYMAPEQITGVALDVRADVYAAGILLFELLADRRPFDYPRRSQLLRAHLLETVPFLDDTREGLTVDAELEAVIRRALEKDPAQRFEHAAAMLEAWSVFEADAIEFTGDPTKRGAERSTHGTSSVVISPEERSRIAEAMEVPTVPADTSAPESGAGEGVAQRDSSPSAAKAAPSKAATKSASPKPAPSAPRFWVTALVWVFALVSLAGLLGLAGYSTTLR